MTLSIESSNSNKKSSMLAAGLLKISCCGAVVCLLSLASEDSRAADFSFKPSLTVSEEYTDNVFASSLNKRTDYITRAQPGFMLQYNAPFWDWNLGYTFDYSHYAKGNRSDDITHNGNLKGLLRLVEEKLFLELNDTYSRVSLDVARNNTDETSFQNQSDRNVATVSPYLVLHPTSATMVKTGYRYVNTWYKDTKAVNKQSHAGFLETSYEVTPQFSLTAGYSFIRDESESDGKSSRRHEANVGPRYEYADKSFIYAQGGVIIVDKDDQPETINPSWNAGITHSFDTMTASLSTSVTYSDDPLGPSTMTTSYKASLSKTLERGSLTLLGSYTEFSDAVTDRLKTKRYTGGFTSSYEIINDLRATLGLTYEHYRDEQLDAGTDKYSVDSGLSYTLGKDISLGLTYKYIDLSSAEIAADNYQVNRVILHVTKRF